MSSDLYILFDRRLCVLTTALKHFVNVTLFESARYFSSTTSTACFPNIYVLLFILSCGHISFSHFVESFCSLITNSMIHYYLLLDSRALSLLMLPMMLPTLFSTSISPRSRVHSSTSCPDFTPKALPSENLHLPISFYKGARSCTLHPISHIVSYNHLHPTYHAFFISLTIESIPMLHLEVVRLPRWKVALDLEYVALLK